MKKKQLRETPEQFQHGGRIGQKAKPARKRPLNVTIAEDLVADAKRLGINISQALEDRLRELVTEEKTRRWQEENREAIEAHNRFIEKHGIWSEKYRSW